MILHVAMRCDGNLGELEASMRSNRLIRKLLRDRRGSSAVEYGIILGFIVMGLFVAVGGVASETLKMWTHVGAETAKAQSSN